MRQCSKTRCHATATALLGYNYGQRVAVIEDAPQVGEPSPHLYPLCGACADSLSAPRGWTVEDHRTSSALFITLPTRPEIRSGELGAAAGS